MEVIGVGEKRVGLLGEVRAEKQIVGQLWNLDLSQRYELVDCYLDMDFFTEHQCDFSAKTEKFLTLLGET